MDPVSQAALGAVVAQTTAHRTLGFRAAAAGAVAGALPDIDVLFSLNGDYFDQLVSHRGITHSLFFAPVVGPVLGWLVWRLESRNNAALRNRRRLVGWTVALTAALFSHPLLDFLTPYGTQLLLPFSNARFAVSAMPIIDPIYTLVLLLGLGIAARRRAMAARVAGITLAVSTAYLGYGWYLNSAAETFATQQLAASGIENARVAAFPTILQIHYRRVVARTPELDRVGFVSMWDPCRIRWRSAPRLDPGLLQAFLATREGAVFDWFTMGWAHYQRNGSGTGQRLTATDLRYGFDENPNASVFSASAPVDGAGLLAGPVIGGRFTPAASPEVFDQLVEATYAPYCRVSG